MVLVKRMSGDAITCLLVLGLLRSSVSTVWQHLAAFASESSERRLYIIGIARHFGV